MKVKYFIDILVYSLSNEIKKKCNLRITLKSIESFIARDDDESKHLSHRHNLITSLINGYAISDVSVSECPRLASNTDIRSSTVPRTQYTYNSANR